MKRWNPYFFRKQGEELNYNKNYLDQLIQVGRQIDSKLTPVIFSLSHLCKLANVSYQEMHAIIARKYFTTFDYPYRNFTIKKRSGGNRWISVPCPSLMIIQHWIASEILRQMKPHQAAYAYVNNLTSPIKSHVQSHCGAKWILKLDIKDFFGSISEKQVYKVFKNYQYPDLLSFEMARLCTKISRNRKGKKWVNTRKNNVELSSYFSEYIGCLPQGAPTSPALSNLVCINMDEELSLLSRNNDANYSRYADDLCFSFYTTNRRNVYMFKKQVCEILWKYGFQENIKKTHIVPPGARKIVTGLIINEHVPTIPREVKDNIKMHLYYAKKFGIPEHCKNKGFRSVIGFKNHLEGLINYVTSVNPEQGKKYEKAFLTLPWLNYKL